MPNAELERLKLVAQIEILEQNVADLEKRLANAYNRLRELDGQLHEYKRRLSVMESLYGVIDETAMD